MKKIIKILVFNLIFCILNVGLFAFENSSENLPKKEKDIILKFELEKSNSFLIHKIRGEVFDKKNKVKIVHYFIKKENPNKIETAIEEFPIKEFNFDFIKTDSNENGEYFYIKFNKGISVYYYDLEGDLFYTENYVEVLL